MGNDELTIDIDRENVYQSPIRTPFIKLFLTTFQSASFCSSFVTLILKSAPRYFQYDFGNFLKEHFKFS